jgi:hypothetical protein
MASDGFVLGSILLMAKDVIGSFGNYDFGGDSSKCTFGMTHLERGGAPRGGGRRNGARN